MLIKNVFLALVGLFSGSVVAAGIFSFITMVGVVTRFAARTKTVKYIMVYEDMVVLGGTAGNLITLFHWQIPGGNLLLLMFGFFSGVFVGCLALALTESLKVFPILTHRFKLKIGLSFMILSLALGKFSSVLYQMYFKWKE